MWVEGASIKRPGEAPKAPDIYGYHEYRQFLRDQLHYLKSAHKISLRRIAKASGVSESYISMVISGSRRLSAEQFKKLAPALKLERSEVSYLEWLIEVVDAEGPEAQLEALKKIQRFRGYQNMNPLEIETYNYLEHWYNIAIRELAQVDGFSADPRWVQAALSFKVSLAEIKDALNFLVGHGFLEKDEHGRFRKPDKLVQCKSGVLKAALTKFHTEMLALAAQSISEIASEERNISAYTCAIPSESIPEAKAILEEARQKIIALSKKKTSGADRVYHFGFLAIPLSQKLGGKS